MASVKVLRGIAHDLAHHSQSSPSWLHPHLSQACRQAGVREVSVDLLAREPYPIGLATMEPLCLALSELRKWFLDLLVRLGHDSGDLRAVVLRFRFSSDRDDYNSAVQATISTLAGREYEGRVDFF